MIVLGPRDLVSLFCSSFEIQVRGERADLELT